MAVAARMPETTGQTYQRYSPGTNERVRRTSFQTAGTVSSGLVVFAENASTEPLKNSMWYAEAPGAGAHAKRRASASRYPPRVAFWTSAWHRRDWCAAERRGCCRRFLRCLRRCWRLADLHPHIEEQ